MLTLATCVPSIFSKYTRSPAVSTMAMAIFRLFLPASVTAAAAILRELSRLTDAPYGFGICANTGTASVATTTVKANFRMFVSRFSFVVSRLFNDGLTHGVLEVALQRPVGALHHDDLHHLLCG